MSKPKTAVSALRARLSLRLGERPDLGGLAAGLFGSLVSQEDFVEVDLLATVERQRLTFTGGPRGGFTVVNAGGAGLTFWDDGARAFARIAPGELPRNTIGPARKLELSRREGEGVVIFDILVEDEVMGALRHEITVSTAPELAPFGPGLLAALHCGPACHVTSGLPWAEIAKAGLIVAEVCYRHGRREPISSLAVEKPELVATDLEAFTPPPGFRPLDDLLRNPVLRPPGDPAEDPDAEPDLGEEPADKAHGRAARAKRIKDALTPDCLGETRLGSITATLHQDALLVASNAINRLAPLIGPTAIAGGNWVVPWLGNLAAATAANPSAPGAGIFSLLRDPRVTAAAAGPGGVAGGGEGLLDSFAFSALTEKDANGQTRTEREFDAGTLAATLAKWGLGAAAAANLIAAGGKLAGLGRDDQILVCEAYETGELGTLTFSLASALGPFAWGSSRVFGLTTPPLFVMSVTGLTGSADFSMLGPAGLVRARIGGAGDIVLRVSTPPLALSASITRATTGFGDVLLAVGVVGGCLAFPMFCPMVATLVTLAAFVLNNITAIAAASPGLRLTYDIAFAFDPATQRVEPSVTELSRAGAVTVTTSWVTPNLIADMVDSLVAAIGDVFDGWTSLLSDQVATRLQALLREQGIQLPVAGRQNELTAVSGGALSSAGAVLQLSADIQPRDDVASHAFTTQTPTAPVIGQRLLTAHLDMLQGLNPQPAPPPPGPGPALRVGVFAGLGLSQNALMATVEARRSELSAPLFRVATPTESFHEVLDASFHALRPSLARRCLTFACRARCRLFGQ